MFYTTELNILLGLGTKIQDQGVCAAKLSRRAQLISMTQWINATGQLLWSWCYFQQWNCECGHWHDPTCPGTMAGVAVHLGRWASGHACVSYLSYVTWRKASLDCGWNRSSSRDPEWHRMERVGRALTCIHRYPFIDHAWTNRTSSCSWDCPMTVDFQLELPV